MAVLPLKKALELFRAYLCTAGTLTLLALFIFLFFPHAMCLHAYADQDGVSAISPTTNGWVVTSVYSFEDTSWNETYNMTNGQIALLKVNGAQFFPSGYIALYGDPKNYTPAEIAALHITDKAEAALHNSSHEMKQVYFWQLPTWIQVSVLSGSLLALAGSIALLPLAIRKLHGPFNNANRSSVLDYILGNPGCTAPEVSREKGMNVGTVRYHVQHLESEGKIILKKIGKFTRLYRNSSTYSDREMVVASHIRNATSRQLLEAILECPGMTNQRLSERFKMDKSTVYVHMQKLINDEIIVSEIEGKQKRYFIAEAARPAVIKLLPLNYQCPGMLREYGKDEV